MHRLLVNTKGTEKFCKWLGSSFSK